MRAVILTCENLRDVGAWIADEGGAVAGMTIRSGGPIKDRGIILGTLEGRCLLGHLGDYMVQGVVGDFSPCTPEVFHRMYFS